MVLHENGPWSVKDGMLVHVSVNTAVSPCDMALGYEGDTLLKCGERSMVVEYMQRVNQAMTDAGLKTKVFVIAFKKSKSLSPDDICTIVNYAGNTVPGSKIMSLLYTGRDVRREKNYRAAELRFLTKWHFKKKKIILGESFFPKERKLSC